MSYLLLAIPVAFFVARRLLYRKPYEVDKQGRYVLLDLHKPVMPLKYDCVNFVGRLFPQKPFTVEGMLRLASRRVGGLSDFGDETRFPFRDGLQVFLTDVNRAPLSFLGRIAVQEGMLRCLTARLLIEDLIKKHPDILEEEIHSPVFVVGVARSGTTHMQRVLSELQDMRSLKYYELEKPVITPEVLAGLQKGKRDARLKEMEYGIGPFQEAKPVINAFHKLDAEEREEHIPFFACVFRSLTFPIMCSCPEYTKWLAKQDAAVEFEYLRRCFQLIQWQDAQLGEKCRRFVTKCVSDVFSLPCLKETFPDAKIVHMHRDPSTSIPSFLYLLTYINGAAMSEIDLKAQGESLVGYSESMMRRAVKNGPQSGVFHVKYEDFVVDNMKVLKEVCEYIGEDLTGHNLENITNFVQENKQHRFGKVLYDPTVFGFTEQELKERLKFYSDFDSTLSN